MVAVVVAPADHLGRRGKICSAAKNSICLKTAGFYMGAFLKKRSYPADHELPRADANL